MKVEVKRDIAGGSVEWEDISGDNVKLMAGQKVNLKVEVKPSGVTPTAYEWILAGKEFKDYTASKSAAELTGLAADDLDDQEVHFYWASGGQFSGHVECKMTFNLQKLTTLSAFDIFEVERPVTDNLKNEIGVVKVVDMGASGWRFRLDPNGGGGGVYFECDVQKWTAFQHIPKGHWHYMQTFTVGTWATKLDGSKWKLKQNGDSVLDTDYPYRPAPFDHGARVAREMGNRLGRMAGPRHALPRPRGVQEVPCR